jgi:hypothetical protein
MNQNNKNLEENEDHQIESENTLKIVSSEVIVKISGGEGEKEITVSDNKMQIVEEEEEK